MRVEGVCFPYFEVILQSFCNDNQFSRLLMELFSDSKDCYLLAENQARVCQ